MYKILIRVLEISFKNQQSQITKIFKKCRSNEKTQIKCRPSTKLYASPLIDPIVPFSLIRRFWVHVFSKNQAEIMISPAKENNSMRFIVRSRVNSNKLLI